jgi:arabinogalactan endo-1,4-beta-galactosidase
MPEYVQVGNEITSGLLWPDGRVGGAYDTPAQWSQLARLLNAAIAGIKDAAGAQTPKIIIHVDRGGDWAATQWYFDNLRKQQVQFDIIGQSYYPFWHGTLDALRACLTNAAARYGKPVAVVETAFPWTNSTSVLGIPATPAGQTSFIAELGKALRRVPGGQGIGIFWWGAEYQHLKGVGTAGFEYKSFFDTAGNVLPAAGALGIWASPVFLNARLTGADLALSWPLSGAGLSLVTATNLTPPVSWLPLSNTVQDPGGKFDTALPLSTNRSGFFRLQSN